MKKKALSGLLLALLTLTTMSITTFAAPNSATPNGAASAETETVGPFEGTFTGTVYGDKGSEAILTLDLIDRDQTIEGTASLGGGLIVNAGGLCGTAALPASSLWAEGESSAKHPDQLTAETVIDVGAFDVAVEVSGELSVDGETMDVTAIIDTPFMCGRNPVIMGTLTTVSAQD